MALTYLNVADKPEAHPDSMATSDDQSPENRVDMHFQHRYLVSTISTVCCWVFTNSIAQCMHRQYNSARRAFKVHCI